jgi:hypothetical protein
VLAAGQARAWHGAGHHVTTLLSIELLEGKVPDFFVEGRALAAHCSLDPDVARLYKKSQVRDREMPEHFINLERLGTNALPSLRSEYMVLCAAEGLNPAEVGFLPYTVAEWTQRLTVMFKEHRLWPDNPHVRTKILVYAGILSHYAGDLCMPLHLTVHYDGRVADPGDKSPRTGIHAKVDAILGKLAFDRGRMFRKIRPRTCPDVMARVLREATASHSLVDRVYGLEPALPDVTAPLPDDARLLAFGRERMRAVCALLSVLYLTAWERSPEIYIPDWHQRPPGAGATFAPASRPVGTEYILPAHCSRRSALDPPLLPGVGHLLLDTDIPLCP